MAYRRLDCAHEIDNSHINAETPGAIHEGGELGYALSVSFGAAMDNPDLIVACVVGDGEAETGPTSAAWHSIKFLDPTESGAVLPILHANGFKISERTIYGVMDDKEIVTLFTFVISWVVCWPAKYIALLVDMDTKLGLSPT